nr:cytochrome c oxidase subunit 3 [Quadraceps punctatus]
MVEESPWPILTSISLSLAVFNLYFYLSSGSGLGVSAVSILSLLGVVCLWFRDVVRESTFQGHHTREVVNGIYLGMILFILSEVMFFFSFFFSYFFLSLNPSVEMGGIWPPVGVSPISFWSVPLLNTLLLLSSGVSVTWAHHSILSGKKKEGVVGLGVTILLGFIFTAFQLLEYWEISFTMADSVFGSLFFIMTGFHGVHVIVGNFFLMVAAFRTYLSHFSKTHHLGFEVAAWYWHFVDVVWLGLFISLYWWGS